jgi:hypothetical protein
MASVNPKNVVESYLNLRSSRKYDELDGILSEKVEYKSPLSKYSSSSELVNSMKKSTDGFTGISVKKVFVDGDDVCAIFDQDSSLGKISFTEWYTVREDRIAKIESTFDTSLIVKSRSQI